MPHTTPLASSVSVSKMPRATLTLHVHAKHARTLKQAQLRAARHSQSQLLSALVLMISDLVLMFYLVEIHIYHQAASLLFTNPEARRQKPTLRLGLSVSLHLASCLSVECP